MARILVAGGLPRDESDPEFGTELNAARQEFAAALGRKIIERGHVLLGGCRTTLDAIVARSAAEAAREKKLEPRRAVRSWVTASTSLSHSEGEIIRSAVSDWKHVPRGYTFPEPIHEADVVILLAGWDGTQYAATWARLANKPLVPVASFGLAAAEIFRDEMANFERRYAAQVPSDEYQTLDRVLSDYTPATIQGFAADVVALAERMIMPSEVFIVMSFAEVGHLHDAHDTFVRVCQAHGLRAYRTDTTAERHPRIIPAIANGIRRSAFVIADVTEPKPNVYYELGYAQALDKKVILTARAGTELPFDIFDVPTIFWESQRQLAEGLERELQRLAPRFTAAP